MGVQLGDVEVPILAQACDKEQDQIYSRIQYKIHFFALGQKFQNAQRLSLDEAGANCNLALIG